MKNELTIIEESTALTAFTEQGGLSGYIEIVRKEVIDFEHDMSNGVKRAKTASLSAKVRKMKTRLDDLGKNLTEDWAKKKKAVDANRKMMRDEFDEIAALARLPLDQWEAEQAAIKEAADFLIMLDDAIAMNLQFNEQKQIEFQMSHMQAIIDNNEFDKRKEYEVEQERIATEIAAQEKEAYEQKLMDDAANLARIQAENAARERELKLEADRQFAINQAAKEKADRERAEIAAQYQKEQHEIAIKKAEQDRINQIEQNRINQEAAVRAEEIRQRDILAKEKADRESVDMARAANVAHTTSICTAAKLSLIKNCGLTDDIAILIVKAIRSGLVDNVSIKF